MGKETKIEWCDATWNPWKGCTKISPGCKNCYAERQMKRFAMNFNVIERSAPATFNLPAKLKDPQSIFVCSWSDFFHKGADDIRPDAWDVIRKNPRHEYMILTKRPERISYHCLPDDWHGGWTNVYIGITAENTEQLAARWRRLDCFAHHLQTVGGIFISYEPALGPLELREAGVFDSKIELSGVIAGGESGSIDDTRIPKLEWMTGIRDQCKEYRIRFFFKQWGRWVPDETGIMIPEKAGKKNRRLEGCLHNELPWFVGGQRTEIYTDFVTELAECLNSGIFPKTLLTERSLRVLPHAEEIAIQMIRENAKRLRERIEEL